MDIQSEVVSAFQAEHKEQVEGIRSILASLREQQAAPDDARWEEAFRMAHTLKGGARVCDLRGVEALGHRMESLFASVRGGTLRFDDGVAQTIYQALDAIEDWMATFSSGGTPVSPDQTLEAIEALLADARPKAPLVENSAVKEPEPTRATPEAIHDTGAPTRSKEIETLRVQAQHLDTMLRATDGLLAANGEQDHASRELARLSEQIRELHRACDSIRSSSASTLRYLSSVPEFAPVARHMESITQQVQDISRQHRQTRLTHQRGAWTLRTISEDLRRSVQHTRMVSAENVFQGLRAMVRNLARDEGKEVEFVSTGMNVQADRMVLQAVKDPLVHALRNAIVHGIEPPDQRVVMEKPRTGRIALNIQTRGNRLCITVEDDGRGIDLKQVARQAVREGFLPDASADTEVGREQVWRVLFRPGFTTSDAVTELAGRGMGLSVVHETAARLRGGARIGPRSDGQGTVLEMVVPLLISAERLLLVRSNDQTFALPIHGIQRLARLRITDVQNVEGRHIAIVDDLPLPLVSLSQAIGYSDAATRVRNESLLVVVIEQGSQRMGLIVDEFLSEREALIKNLDGPASRLPYFSGAVVLDDNLVVLVIDPLALPGHSIHGRLNQAPATETVVKAPTILVVDDSFTTRTLEKSILETNGYAVRIAVDGVEAMNVLRSESIQVVVADVQMPRMDGLTLLKKIRDNPKLESLPVILVTSLDREEDRKQGLDLGANAYIVKRKFDHQDLLNTIQRFV